MPSRKAKKRSKGLKWQIEWLGVNLSKLPQEIEATEGHRIICEVWYDPSEFGGLEFSITKPREILTKREKQWIAHNLLVGTYHIKIFRKEEEDASICKRRGLDRRPSNGNAGNKGRLNLEKLYRERIALRKSNPKKENVS
ncbi:MAG: hypothetical protein HQ553_04450 [Chloroflexi bacterium]|nr:hypothetical protein [Chloroflexota bacterium]